MKATRERPLAPLGFRLLCLSLLGLVLTCSIWMVIFQRYPGSGGGDGPFFFRLIEAGKVSVSRWHELPLWNPYECGGVPLWDNPQSIVSSPLVLLLQPLTTAATIGVWVIVHVVVGFVGMWIFAREELGSSRIAAFTAACLFAFSAQHSNHAAGGHTAFATFQLTPLALLMWRRGERDARHAIGLGLIFALMIYEGGVYAPALVGLMLAIETVTRLRSGDRLIAIARAAGIVGLVTLTVGAARVIPVADQILHNKRGLGGESEAMDWQMLKDMFLDRQHALRTAGHQYVWGEFVAYIGPVILVLMALGVLVSAGTETWFLVVAIALFVLMLGHFSPRAPWTLLKTYVPPFTSMRVPLRFRLLLAMFIAGWVAIAMDRVPALAERTFGRTRLVRAFRVVIIGAALFGAGDVAGHSVDVINSQWDGPPQQKNLKASSPNLYLGGPGLAQFIDQPRQNRGRLDCWEEWAPFAGAPLWTGDAPQARIPEAEAARGTVTSVRRSQNAFVIDADAKEEVTVQLNTSWARGWRTTAGTIREESHQLVVRLPPGHHVFRVWYWPVGLTAGFVLTALGLLASIVMIGRLGRRRALS